VLVYSGSSSVGQYAIQLARLSGYRVVTTASPKNTALVMSLGADAVVNHRAPDVVAQIKAATGDAVAFAIDTVSMEDTQQTAIQAIGGQGGELLVLLAPFDSAAKLRPDVKIKCNLFFPVCSLAN
jgi:NADPH:quinone reductase-like Zn-dependent oxidoreductase